MPCGLLVLQPLHALDKVGIGRANDRVVVIAHQLIFLESCLAALACFAQGAQEQLVILVAGEDRLTPVPTRPARAG